jgi:hypothetical protein
MKIANSCEDIKNILISIQKQNYFFMLFFNKYIDNNSINSEINNLPSLNSDNFITKYHDIILEKNNKKLENFVFYIEKYVKPSIFIT